MQAGEQRDAFEFDGQGERQGRWMGRGVQWMRSEAVTNDPLRRSQRGIRSRVDSAAATNSDRVSKFFPTPETSVLCGEQGMPTSATRLVKRNYGLWLWKPAKEDLRLLGLVGGATYAKWSRGGTVKVPGAGVNDGLKSGGCMR